MLSHPNNDRPVLEFPQHQTRGRSLAQLAAVIPAKLRVCLQKLPPQGVTLQDLGHLKQRRVGSPTIEASLDYLADLELVFLDERKLWHPSWTGIGLRNWFKEQLLHKALKAPMPLVQPGENGHWTCCKSCEDFRPMLSRGGNLCWCGHPFHRHPLI